MFGNAISERAVLDHALSWSKLRSQWQWREVSVKVVLLVLVLVAMPLAVRAEAGSTVGSGELVFANGGWELTHAQRRELTRKAAAGDGAAAYRLSLFWGLSHGNRRQELHWLRLGAKNGNPNAEYNLGFRLAKSEDPTERARGIVWLKRAKQAGFEPARELLSELGQ